MKGRRAERKGGEKDWWRRVEGKRKRKGGEEGEKQLKGGRAEREKGEKVRRGER